MSDRQILLYFAWSSPAETGVAFATIDDRFPAIFELRRLFYPRFEPLADAEKIDQGIAGFLDHIQKPNFLMFTDQAAAQAGRPVIQIERVMEDATEKLLDERLIAGVDAIIVISFDSFRTRQDATSSEIAAVRRFLDDPDHLIFVCPHHDIGETGDEPAEARISHQTAEFLHHGDRGIPPRQGFGGFARTLLAGLGVPVENRFGL